MLLDQIDALSAQIGTLTSRIEELIGAMPAARGVNADGTTGPGAGTGPGAAVLPALARLDEIPGISQAGAQGILAETGLDMSRFPTAGHLVSWAKLVPAHHPVRGPQPLRQDRQGQPLPQGHPRRGRRRGRQDRHLPGRAVPAAGQADRQAQSPRRRRPLHPGHHLAPAIRSRRPVLRTRLRLPRHPHQHPAQGTRPHPPARSPRLHRHPHPGSLTRTTHAQT